ncbi:MAG: glycosyltransferase family 2 protein [Lachnospiraceae bacterium]|nr:glycosyltransferase family 2 protein [Lachnospiraceae bacterium]
MKVSFVIPCYRSQRTIEYVVNEIEQTMSGLQDYEHEIILINDSSPDDTFMTIRSLAEKNDRIIGVDLAKNFGQHAALMAGFGFAAGDIVVCLDDDGQTPAGEVTKLLEKIEEGYDVVYAKYDEKKHSWFRNTGSRINSRMTEVMLGKPSELYISSYFAARRFVVDEMLRYRNAFPYVIGLVLRTTNKICNVDVKHRDRREGESGYSLKKLLALWINGFTSFSVKPLRAATFCGLIIALTGFLYTIWTVIKKFINPDVPIGWSSTMSVILVIGGMILLVLGMIGEYIGRIYICINDSPQYVIREVIGNTGHADDPGNVTA